MRTIYLATGNWEKVREAEKILEKFDVELKHLKIEKIEIQSESPCEIAEYSLSQIIKDPKNKNKSIIVEDTGLFINALGGFPGPYSAYVFKTIGNKGILKLMNGENNRAAEFKSAIAYYKPNNEIKCVTATVRGEISTEERGNGWGYDPIFIPAEGDGRTYAEMELSEKNKLSHRYNVLKLFAETLLE